MTDIRNILVFAGCLGGTVVAIRSAAAEQLPACKIDVPDGNDVRAIVLAEKITVTMDAKAKLDKPGALAGCTPNQKHEVDRTSCAPLFDPDQLRGRPSVQLAELCVLALSGFAAKIVAGNTEILELSDTGAIDLSKLAATRILLTSTAAAVVPTIKEKPETSFSLPAAFKAGETIAFILKDGKLHSIEVAAKPIVKLPATDPAAPATPAVQLADKVASDACGANTTVSDKTDFNVLCFAGDGARIALVDPPSDGGTIMRPNRSILVLVVRMPETKFTVTVDGDYGVFRPGLSDQAPPDPKKGAALAATEPGPAPPPLVDRHAFGPRLPGKAAVHVRPTDTKSTVAETVIELIVEETYAGALRVGIGGVFGGAIDRGFTLRAAPGSGQQEIVAANGGDMDAELVVGASIFLEQGGRSYAVPGHNKRFAPYFGIGVLNQTDSGLKAFRSFHAGLEFELNSHFSIALTAIARRITRLTNASVGDPVQMSGSVPTETGFAFGWGIVINLSPDFLRLAARSGSSFFGN